MSVERTIKASIRRGKNAYVAECVGLPIVTQGKTLDETVSNLQEAVSLHLEGEDFAELGLCEPLTFLVLLELEAAHA